MNSTCDRPALHKIDQYIHHVFVKICCAPLCDEVLLKLKLRCNTVLIVYAFISPHPINSAGHCNLILVPAVRRTYSLPQVVKVWVPASQEHLVKLLKKQQEENSAAPRCEAMRSNAKPQVIVLIQKQQKHIYIYIYISFSRTQFAEFGC